jgi:Fur family peroxide stress response transcriptional regulator
MIGPPFSSHDLLKYFETACRKQNLRITPQRIEIFRELAQAKDHPTAETLHKRLLSRMPTLSLDTVYRTLATLANNGLVNKVETSESQARFEVIINPHHHAICSSCGKIMDFEWETIDAARLPGHLDSWGKVERRSVIVYGICSDCLGKT